MVVEVSLVVNLSMYPESNLVSHTDGTDRNSTRVSEN